MTSKKYSKEANDISIKQIRNISSITQIRNTSSIASSRVRSLPWRVVQRSSQSFYNICPLYQCFQISQIVLNVTHCFLRATNVSHCKHLSFPFIQSCAESQCQLRTPRFSSFNSKYKEIGKKCPRYSMVRSRYPGIKMYCGLCIATSHSSLRWDL